MSILEFLSLIMTFKFLITIITGSDLKEESINELKNFKYCLRQRQPPNLSACMGRSALNFIQRFEEQDNVTFIEDLVLSKNENAAGRSLVNILDADSVDFRGILENAGAVMGQRSLEWHMDNIYPGLMLKIGPTADANSLAEFVLDTTVAERQYALQEPSTARILAKEYLLPFLLGLKFNLVALVPLLFAGICFLLKKSLFFAKLAIYVSSFLGLGGALGALSTFGGGAATLGGSFTGGLGGGLGGSLGSLGSLGGLGGLGGFSTNAGIPSTGLRPNVGHFPGKTTVYGQYDELHHSDQQPYKRADRKFNLDKSQEYTITRQTSTVPSTATKGTKATTDRFYEYEKHLLFSDDNSAMPRSLRSTSQSGSIDTFEKQQPVEQDLFQSNDNFNGWQAVNVRI